MTDPIIDEVRSTRERLAMASGGDIHSIAEAARKRQEASGTKTVSRPTRKAEISRNNPMHSSGGSAVSGKDTSTPAAG
jgi:hypothetical protein